MTKRLRGRWITLDKVYELLYLGNLLPSETTKEVDEIPRHLPGNDMALKVAKAITLLESVTGLPRTPHNIAVVLHPSVDADSIKKEVDDAIKTLEKAQIIRDSEEGYKLLTVQEKTWDTTRSGLEAKPADRNRITRELFKEVFADPRIRSYRYKNLRPFRVSLAVQGETVDSDGQVPLNVLIAEDSGEWPSLCKEARDSSNAKPEEAFWVIALTDEIHESLQEVFRSREMVSTYERLAAQGKLTPEEASCLAEEKVRKDRYQRLLRTKLTEVIQSGSGFFRGVQRDGSSLGQSLPEVLQKLLDLVIPDLYPKLEMGIRPLKGDEAEKFLTAANLRGLPPVFHDGPNALNLVINQGGKFVPNISADICKEVLAYLVREHKYGNKVTGKMLEMHFQGVGYGWDREVIQLVLAVLLRGGAVEVTHQGRKYRNHNDPACRVAFTNAPAFRSASFSPREPIDLRTLADAARHYEEITGKDVDIEESAITEAFKKVALDDRELLLPLVARMRALHIPGTEVVEGHLQTVDGIIDMPADDSVRTLAGEGKSYKEARSHAARLAEALTDVNVKLFQRAGNVLHALWPVLKEKGVDKDAEAKAEELSQVLKSEKFHESIEALKQAASSLSRAYYDLYQWTHAKRAEVFRQALETVKGMPEWAAVSNDPSITENERTSLIAPLYNRATDEFRLEESEAVCKSCKATIAQMETDILAVDVIRDQVIRRILEKAAPEEKTERVRVSTLFTGKLETADDVEMAIAQLREHLLKLVASGVKVILE